MTSSEESVVGKKGEHQHRFIRQARRQFHVGVFAVTEWKHKGQRWAESEWECTSGESGWSGGGAVGSISSGLAQASLVCLMCHYERLAPGAGLQLSHSIISEADSQTHTAHTHGA